MPENLRGKERKIHVQRVPMIYGHPQVAAHSHLDCTVRVHVFVWLLHDTRCSESWWGLSDT